MEESIFWSGDYYRAYKDLHEAARRNALGLQEVLDLMASELEETLQVRVENLVKPDEFDPFSDS